MCEKTFRDDEGAKLLEEQWKQINAFEESQGTQRLAIEGSESNDEDDASEIRELSPSPCMPSPCSSVGSSYVSHSPGGSVLKPCVQEMGDEVRIIVGENAYHIDLKQQEQYMNKSTKKPRRVFDIEQIPTGAKDIAVRPKFFGEEVNDDVTDVDFAVELRKCKRSASATQARSSKSSLDNGSRCRKSSSGSSSESSSGDVMMIEDSHVNEATCSKSQGYVRSLSLGDHSTSQRDPVSKYVSATYKQTNSIFTNSNQVNVAKENNCMLLKLLQRPTSDSGSSGNNLQPKVATEDYKGGENDPLGYSSVLYPGCGYQKGQAQCRSFKMILC